MSNGRNNEQGRFWCGTWNNPPEADNLGPSGWPAKCQLLRSVSWQLERSESGTLHYQIYAEFRSNIRFNKLRRTFGSEIHWEKRGGTRDQALAYVRKEETRVAGPFHAGEDYPKTKQGQRTDLEEVRKKIVNGATELEIANEHFGTWCANYRAFARFTILSKPKRREWITFTTVYFGSTGTGKTRRADYEAGPDAYWVSRPSNGQPCWVDGYCGQEHVIIDEFYGWIQLSVLLRMCDRYAYNMQTKGGYTAWMPKKIWITSNVHPDAWYKNAEEVKRQALRRRLGGEFGTVVCMDDYSEQNPWEPPVGASEPDLAALEPVDELEPELIDLTQDDLDDQLAANVPIEH